MKILSVNSAMPTTITINGKEVLTSIHKKPAVSRTKIDQNGLINDQQADLIHHGGLEKAVYAYGVNHYHYWQKQIGQSLQYGAMGENLSLELLDETTVCIGDRLVCHDVILTVTQFRQPCFKLGAKYQRTSLPLEFIEYGFSGAYFKVEQSGEVAAGDEYHWETTTEPRVSLHDLFCACFHPISEKHLATLSKAVNLNDLTEEWRVRIQHKLDKHRH